MCLLVGVEITRTCVLCYLIVHREMDGMCGNDFEEHYTSLGIDWLKILQYRDIWHCSNFSLFRLVARNVP